MLVVRESTYDSFICLTHLQTIPPNATRRRIQVDYRSERFELPINDFIDVDWLEGQRTRSPNAVASSWHCLKAIAKLLI